VCEASRSEKTRKRMPRPEDGERKVQENVEQQKLEVRSPYQKRRSQGREQKAQKPWKRGFKKKKEPEK